MVLERGSIRLDVAAESQVSVEVYALDSRRVKTLVDRRLGVGAYSLHNPWRTFPPASTLSAPASGSRQPR